MTWSMTWSDYIINQAGPHFRVEGEWPGEVMGVKKDGSLRDYWLYKPGDVFIVDENGWLRKVDEVTAMIYNYENKAC